MSKLILHEHMWVKKKLKKKIGHLEQIAMDFLCAGKPLTIHSWLKKIRLDSKRYAARIYVLLFKQKKKKKESMSYFVIIYILEGI